MEDFYDLDGNKVSYETWEKIFDSKDRHIAKTDIEDKGVWVSTVWTGLAWALDIEEVGGPLIFETMAFSLEDNDWDDLGCWRWSSKEEAARGHAEVVDGIRSGAIVLDQSSNE